MTMSRSSASSVVRPDVDVSGHIVDAKALAAVPGMDISDGSSVEESVAGSGSVGGVLLVRDPVSVMNGVLACGATSDYASKITLAYYEAIRSKETVSVASRTTSTRSSRRMEKWCNEVRELTDHVGRCYLQVIRWGRRKAYYAELGDCPSFRSFVAMLEPGDLDVVAARRLGLYHIGGQYGESIVYHVADEHDGAFVGSVYECIACILRLYPNVNTVYKCDDQGLVAKMPLCGRVGMSSVAPVVPAAQGSSDGAIVEAVVKQVTAGDGNARLLVTSDDVFSVCQVRVPVNESVKFVHSGSSAVRFVTDGWALAAIRTSADFRCAEESQGCFVGNTLVGFKDGVTFEFDDSVLVEVTSVATQVSLLRFCRTYQLASVLNPLVCRKLVSARIRDVDLSAHARQGLSVSAGLDLQYTPVSLVKSVESVTAQLLRGSSQAAMLCMSGEDVYVRATTTVVDVGELLLLLKKRMVLQFNGWTALLIPSHVKFRVNGSSWCGGRDRNWLLVLNSCVRLEFDFCGRSEGIVPCVSMSLVHRFSDLCSKFGITQRYVAKVLVI